MNALNHRVLKRGLELLISDKSTIDRSEFRKIVERETVKVTAERVNEAVRYSESSTDRKWYQIYSDDFDLTHLTPSEKSAGRIFAGYLTINSSERLQGVALKTGEEEINMDQETPRETPDQAVTYPTNTGDRRETVETEEPKEPDKKTGENNDD